MRTILPAAALILCLGACSRQTQRQADATANSAAGDIRSAGHAIDRETAGTRHSLAAAGHDLAKAADHAEGEAKRLVNRANRAMASDR